METVVPFLRVSKMKDREIESVITLVIKLLVESNLPSDIFAKLIGDLSQLLQKLQQAINKQRKNELTAEIRKADEERCLHFNTFVKGVEYYLTMTGTPRAEAAHLLEAVIEKYGKGLVRESDMVETVKIRSLIKDLTETERAAALETLSMSETIDTLNSSNEYFDILYLKRANSDAEDDTPTLTSLRKEVANAFYLLVYLINFLNRKEPDAYGGVAGDITEIIGNVMTVAKARQTRNSHEEENEEEEVVVEDE